MNQSARHCHHHVMHTHLTRQNTWLHQWYTSTAGCLQYCSVWLCDQDSQSYPSVPNGDHTSCYTYRLALFGVCNLDIPVSKTLLTCTHASLQTKSGLLLAASVACALPAQYSQKEMGPSS